MGWPMLAHALRRILRGMGRARAAFLVDPDRELTISVLTNMAGGNPQRFMDEIAAIYLSP